MNRRRAAALALALVIVAAPVAATGQDSRLEVQDADTVKAVLARQVGKRATVVLARGVDLTGVVARVGAQVVHLSHLAGRDFFDAVVPLDRIEAVVVQARTR